MPYLQFLMLLWDETGTLCIVSQNIYTPTTEGIPRKPPSSPEFPFFDHKNNPSPPLWNFLYCFVDPHTLSKKFWQENVLK